MDKEIKKHLAEILDDENIEVCSNEIRDLEKLLGISEGFCLKLLDEDDWSFVIKLHAILEAAIGNMLKTTIENVSIDPAVSEKLEKIFSRLEMSNVDTGKVAFAKALNLLKKYEVEFITTLSQIRNQYVHNISNIEKSLNDNIKESHATKIEKFFDNSDITKNLILQKPKLYIWKAGILLLSIIRLEHSISNSKKKTLLLELETLDKLYKNNRCP